MQKELVHALQKYGLLSEVINAHAKELEQMPTDLVAYDGILPHEGRRERDLRMECADVYISGREKTLAKILYKIQPSDTKKMLPWEVIIFYHNQISRLLSELLAESKKGIETSVVAEYQNNEPINPTSAVSTDDGETDNLTNENIGETQTCESETPMPVEKTEAIEACRETVDTEIKEQVTAECDNSVKEKSNMSSIDELMNKADEMGEVTPTNVAETTKKAKPEKLDKEIQEQVNKELSNSHEARLAAVKNEHIDALISSAPSIKSRLVSATNIRGKLVSSKGANDDFAKKIDAKIDGFVSKFYYTEGKKPVEITYAQWLQLQDAEKFANVVPEYTQMAKDILALLLQAKENPAIDVDLLAPEKDNVNFKGLKIAGNIMSKEEVTNYLADKTLGYSYAADSLTEDGQEIPDKVVRVQVATVSKSKKGNGVNTETIVRKSITATLKGRDLLIGDGKVEFLFPNVNKETPTTTPLTVAINGKAAAIKYYVRDEKGAKVIVGKPATDKHESTEHEQVRTATLRGAGAVYAVIKEFAPAMQGGDTPSLAKARWGVTLPAVKETSVFLTDMANSPIFKIAISADVDRGSVKASFFQNVTSMVNKVDEAKANEAAASFNS